MTYESKKITRTPDKISEVVTWSSISEGVSRMGFSMFYQSNGGLSITILNTPLMLPADSAMPNDP